MIYFRLDIKNIFRKEDNSFCEKNWYHKLPQERSIDIDYGKIDNTLLTIKLDTSFTGRDHAGPEFEFSILSYGIRIMIPKARHWNYEKDCWMESYDVWMEKTTKLFEDKYPNFKFHNYLFQEYYDDGLSPLEAIAEYEK